MHTTTPAIGSIVTCHVCDRSGAHLEDGIVTGIDHDVVDVLLEDGHRWSGRSIHLTETPTTSTTHRAAAQH